MTETKTILIVEDEKIVARDIQRSLEDAGYHVLPPASTGEQAIRLASQADADLALMDIRIKGHMDGIETAKILRERFGIPVIYLSAYADDPTVQRAKLTEPYGYLVKPIKMNELYGAVEVALYKHTSEVQRRWQREALLKRTQAMAHLGSWELDLVNNHLSWSDETYRIFGFQPQEFEATIAAFLAAVHSHDRAAVEAAYNLSLQEKQTCYEIEHRIVRSSDGEVRFVHEKCEHIRGPSGRILRSVGMIQDITERKQAEEQLTKAKMAAEQASQARQHFLASMSHEIRTPLNVIVGLCYLLQKDSIAPRQQRRLDQIAAAADHLVSVIDGILDLSRIDANRLVLDHREFQLGTLLDKVFAILEQAALAKGLDLTVAAAPPLLDATLCGDLIRLSQILINLGHNAIKYTESGSVRIAVTQLDADDFAMRLRFAVEDTGIGISTQDQTHLFGAFEQAKSAGAYPDGGSGLGLCLSQRLVQLMGGTIHVHSQAGRGSQFSFELDLRRGDAPSVPTELAHPRVDLTRKRLLVAEDHPVNGELLLTMLAGLGAAADLAADGVQAVEMARIRSYDLILMDVQMPVMDGLEASRAIRALPGYQCTPIVALTAKAFCEDRDDCMAAGMTGYLTKPLTQTALAAAVADALDNTSAPTATSGNAADPGLLESSLAVLPGLDSVPFIQQRPEGQAAYAQFLDAFVAMHGQDMERLRALVAAGEREAGDRLLHALQGISATLGIQRVFEPVKALAAALQAGSDPVDIAPLISACETELARLAAAVAPKSQPRAG